MSNPPQNFYFYNMVKNRTGANWKLNKSTGKQIIMEKAPMNLRPGVNKFAGLEYKGNDFAARPLKHYRRQYTSTTPLGVGGPTLAKDLMVNVENPGSTIITNNLATSCEPCTYNTLIPDYMVGFRSNGHINNKVGRDYPDSFAKEVDYTNPCSQFKDEYIPCCPDRDYKKCIYVCDPEKTARKRTQYPSAVNTDRTKPKYYQSNAAYLQGKCKTFKQTQFNFLKTNKCPTVNLKPSPETANCYEFYPNCAENCDCTGPCKNRKVYYKPNNPQYAQQGAVSSSSRIARLKLNTINTFANSFVSTKNYGPAVANAYAYSGRPERPFTLKTKTFNCSANKSLFHKNGNKTICKK